MNAEVEDSQSPVLGLTASQTAPSPTGVEATVLAVVSGDTIDVSVDGLPYRVSLIGVKAPDADACFASESHDYLKQLLGSGTIDLSSDSQLGLVDKQGNWWRYVSNSDGVLANQAMLEAGMAQERGGDTYEHRVVFVGAAESAKAASKGLWGECASPSPTPTLSKGSTPDVRSTVTPTPVSQPIVVSPIAPSPTPNHSTHGSPTPRSKPTAVPTTPTPTPTPPPSIPTTPQASNSAALSGQ